MKILVAPDSFKGCMTALQAAEEIEKGILAADPNIKVIKVPMADGGEGTVNAMVDATEGHFITEEVSDPLDRSIKATYGILGGGSTAIIEMAAASGLPLLSPHEKNPLITTTKGTGQLILSALDKGAKKIIVGIGGSATVDGGLGMAKALGVKFFDSSKNLLPDGGVNLQRLAHIDVSGIDPRIKEIEFIVACDVDNPLTGPKGAARIFGPQKGATPEMVETLESALNNLGQIIKTDLGKDVSQVPGAGAAGGLGAGLIAFLGAKLKPGIDIILETVGLSEKLKDCDLAITGEGQMDYQTVFGKTPIGVVKAARSLNIPVIAITGGLGKNAKEVNKAGIYAYFSSIERPLTEEELKTEGPRALADCTEQVIRLLKLNISP